jgi:ABC-type transport system involved in cytochrome c biogenesis ATPase subunit
MDEVEIYTAVIDQLYTQDDTFGGSFQAPDVYILAKTDDSVGDPDIEQSESQILSTAVQAKITLALAHLPARIIWVADETAVPIDTTTGAVANDGVILTLGNIHSQRDGTILVSSSIYIASLAASGQTYILDKVNGVWQINGTTGVRWIS